MSVEKVDEDRRRAEVFDALSHPVRIMILKALNEESLGFADLKKKLGIESSGHLQHHINKLSGLIKTDDYGKYALSDQGKDALHSVNTVESLAGSKANENEKAHTSRRNVVLKSTVVVLALLLALSSALAVFEYNNVLSLQSEISQRDSVIVDRDTLITQLDTALHLAESRVNLKLPSESQYLTTLPDQNGEEDATKIFLSSTAAGYHYLPPYPFETPWFNGSGGGFSSQRVFELTNNMSITLSFWGWTFDAGGLMAGRYEYGIWTGDPVLIIAVTIRNDYTSADADNGDLGSPIGNRTGSYISSINLGLRLYGQNGSIIQALESENTPAKTASSRTAIGGAPFLLGSGQTKQVVFYLSPSGLDIDAIDHYEIYVSSLSAY
jgi:DNA-binding HxlR family transcriptional regulator